MQEQIDRLAEAFRNHEHNRADSRAVKGQNLAKAPQTAMTTANTTVLSTGGAAVLSTSDQTVLDNMRTRINELETKLQTLGLLQ